MICKTDPARLQECTSWYGDYNGIRLIVKCQSRPGLDVWNGEGWAFYLVIHKDQVSPEVWETICVEPTPSEFDGKPHYSTWNIPILSSLDWHGDCTWYERNYDKLGQVDSVQAGCDFMHHFDTGRVYTISTVWAEAERCADSLIEAIAPKVWCSSVGKWFDRADGTFVDGHFYSIEGQQWRLDQGWKALPEVPL